MVVLLSVFVLGGAAPVSFRAVKGKGGQSALELSCSARNGGESASGGCGGGSGASQLWSLVVVSSPSVFVLGGAGASQLPGCEGEGGPVSFGVVFVVCFCFETSRRASQLPGL